MDAKELIKTGQLAEARSQLSEAVKTSPADVSNRTLLFQVLIFCGEWDKARRHLEIIATQDPSREAGVQIYLNLVQAETKRLEVFKRNRQPSFLPETSTYFESYDIAFQKIAEKKFAEAGEMFAQIETQRPKISGTLNGNNFSGFKETDTLLSCFLEAFIHERYVWIPFESLRELSIPAPKTLFDLLWASAQITTWEGLNLNCFLPVIYPQSFLHEDDRMKLGRLTDWIKLGAGLFKGVGQHVFLVGEDEIAILEIREAIFNPPVLETNDDNKP